MPPLAVTPNRVPNLIYIFQINLRQQKYVDRLHHDNEIESVECVSFEKDANMISKGKIYVTVPVTAKGTYLLTKNLKQF